MLPAPELSNLRAKKTCCPMMSQVAECWARPSNSQASCAAPVIVRDGRSAAAQTLVPSPQA